MVQVLEQPGHREVLRRWSLEQPASSAEEAHHSTLHNHTPQPHIAATIANRHLCTAGRDMLTLQRREVTIATVAVRKIRTVHAQQLPHRLSPPFPLTPPI